MSKPLYFVTRDPTPLAASQAWTKKLEQWHKRRKALGEAFNGKASCMTSGTRYYVGGIKLKSDDMVLDPRHWRRPDRYGYSDLRSSALTKGLDPEWASIYREAHVNLLRRWGEFVPASIDSHELWQGLGLVNGGLQLSAVSCFELDGAVYIAGPEFVGKEVPGAKEILGSEYLQAEFTFKAGE